MIGGMTPVCSARASELYKIFLEGECVVTNSRTAEMCKLTENSFRDVNIAFANELSLICADQGINVWELIRTANRHPRVNILQRTAWAATASLLIRGLLWHRTHSRRGLSVPRAK